MSDDTSSAERGVTAKVIWTRFLDHPMMVLGPFALIVYVLSLGPVDKLVDGGYLPSWALYYERPIYAVAEKSEVFSNFLDWYVGELWKVDEPALRGL